MTETIYSFPPVARSDARILILGSMPGKKSLAEQQYYAHPRNAFWPITATLFQFDHDTSYQQRINSLLSCGVALWDVMATCVRRSSLDSDIVESTIIANDFAGFLGCHRDIGTICFNGQKAAHSFRKYVEPSLKMPQTPSLLQLPSTSPANARLGFEEKLLAWRRMIPGTGLY